MFAPMDLIIAITAVTIITVLSEAVLWMMFRRKAQPLAFPREFDTSYFRFFELSKLRLIMIIHTIFLLIVLILLYIYLW